MGARYNQIRLGEERRGLKVLGQNQGVRLPEMLGKGVGVCRRRVPTFSTKKLDQKSIPYQYSQVPNRYAGKQFFVCEKITTKQTTLGQI